MSDAPPEQLLDMLVGLSVIAQSAGPQVQAELAALQLQASELLWPARQQLGPADGRTLQQLRAEALAAAGHSDQARTAYAQLAREHPDNGQIQQAYAQLLLDSDDPQLLEQALGQWRRVASRSRPRSESWYRAKYSVALAQYKQGDKQQAAQLIRYLQATPPGLQDTALKPRFLELLQRCQQ